MRVPLNIVFDLGGVLLDIDYNKTEQAFIKLGFTNFREMYNQFKANSLFEDLETGRISPEAFLGELKELAPGPVSETQLRDAWNAMLLDFREPSLAFLPTLAKDHRIFLLSNTNAIHHQAFMKIFKRGNFDDYFRKAYYSHDLGLRKPDREIFDFVIADAGLDPADTLFIDDSYNNIDGAKLAGLQAHLLQPGEKVEELLAK